MNTSRSIKTNSENTCSKLKFTLDRLDISKLKPEDIQSLINISESKCPDDTYYLNKLYDMIVSFDETLMDKAVGFKNNFDDFLYLQRMLSKDVKNLKIQNKKLEDEKNQLKIEVNECKSKMPTITQRNDRSNNPQISTIRPNPIQEELEEIKIPLTSRSNARRKTPRKNNQKRPWIY